MTARALAVSAAVGAVLLLLMLGLAAVLAEVWRHTRAGPRFGRLGSFLTVVTVWPWAFIGGVSMWLTATVVAYRLLEPYLGGQSAHPLEFACCLTMFSPGAGWFAAAFAVSRTRAWLARGPADD